MLTAGIDIGLDGALVFLENGKEVKYKTKMPIIKEKNKRVYDVDEIVLLLKRLNPDYSMIEKPRMIPKTGKMAIANMFYGFGMFEGILTALSLNYDYTSPREWQKSIFKGKDSVNTKIASISFAKRMFPDQDWKKSSRSKNTDHNLTDGVCIALYCYQKYR